MDTENRSDSARKTKRHYWLREDFDHLMGLLPGADRAWPDSGKSASSLFYPKHTEGAVAELKLRGLKCDGYLLTELAEKDIVNPGRGHSLVSDNEGNVHTVPSSRILYWSKADIDLVAEHLYQDERNWTPWTHFCWVANLRFGQVAKAHRVAAARYGLGFSVGWDVLGLVTVIEPPEDSEDYAYLRFLPASAKVAPEDKG
ncbi:MAG: hypothetical protein FJ288_02285 [Planctomycetes bacterium]|nr:hypothetical protein [Planctomycetota bacterium]